jgi:two-component system chemotaxis response regulator CheB
VLALGKVDELAPDILTLDIEMPEMDGLETLSRLHQRHPEVRVIMFSTLTERGARATIDSLLRGASEYVTKPVNTGSSEEAIARLREVLLPKLKQFYTLKPKAPAVSSALLAANATQVAISPPVISTIAPTHMSAVMPAKTAVRRTRPYRILAIGVSTGGPTALGEVMPEIPADFPLPIVIVQHMPPLFTQVLAERLNGKCRIRVVEAGHNMLLEPGTAYIAPGNFHMRFETHGPQTLIALDQGPMENSCRPAVDVMLRSAAEVFQGDVLVAILTGMGRDGALGAGLVKSRGGYVIAQDHDSSVVWGMPGAVVEAGLADMVVSLKSVGQCLMRQVRQVANA